MCGIAGIISELNVAAADALAAMTASQVHRGPDDAGEHVQPFGSRLLALGHRRLSILDLSPSGHQPMVNPVTGDRIIFNGEIYNFAELRRELESAGVAFKGHSDTEVLLHGLSRHGAAYLSRLQGMYAFAFHDARANTLLLARDPLGIKPLYLAQTSRAIVFASEVRAILASGLVSQELDPAGVASFVAYGAVQQPATIFRGIHSLPPGAYQVITAADPATPGPVTYFWRWPAPTSGLSVDGAIERLRTSLDQAVRDHLVADVPVGLFLSSGIDSTIMAALASRHTPRLRSFTVGFADQPDMSELPLARDVARELDLDHSEIVINGPDAEAAAVAWLESLDQPSIDGLNVFLISQVVRREGITVALSGQGGDELFCGYPAFEDVPRLTAWMRRLRGMPAPLRVALARAATFRNSEAVRQKLIDVVTSDGSPLALYTHRRRAMSNRQLKALGIDPAALGISELFLPPGATDVLEPLAGAADLTALVSQYESRLYQGNTLLRDADANGMQHSIEIRVPFLDQRVVELAASLPGHVRRPAGTDPKHLLRSAFADELPTAVLEQTKRGFGLPIKRWMLGPLRDLCQAALANLRRSGLLRPAGVDEVWRTFVAEPESPVWSRAFALCVLGVYLERSTHDTPGGSNGRAAAAASPIRLSAADPERASPASRCPS